MKTTITSLLKTASIACALAVVAPGHVSGAASDLLEQGIYAEETKGDLDEALSLYRKALAEAKASRSASAQAQFRIGQCYLKKNRNGDAIAAFQKLVDAFPDEKELATKAKAFLPTTLALQPIPWTDGERMVLAVELQTGLDIGVTIYHADFVQANGANVWRVGGRVDAIGQSYSYVDVDPDTFHPLSSRWDQALLGDFTSVYGADSVSVQKTGADEVKKYPLSGRVFDNEEVVHLLRRLPLASGYKTTIPCFVCFSGLTIPLGVDVTGPEPIEVKAGKFDCFKLQLSIGQTFWYSADARRLLVKFEAGGAIAELEEVVQHKPGEPARFQSNDLGVALQAPSDWYFHRHVDGKSKDQMIDILDPRGEIDDLALKLAPLSSLPAASQASPRAYLDASNAELCRALADAKVDPASWTNLLVDGRPAVSSIVTFTDKKKEMTAYTVTAFGTTNVEQFMMTVERNKFDTFKPILDTIVASFHSSR